MRLGTIFEVGVRILRRHWASLLALSLLFAGPGALLTAVTGMRVTDVALDLFPGLDDGVIQSGVTISDEQLQRMTGALGAYALATIVAGALASIGALGFSAVVAADYHARRIELGDLLHVCLERAPSAIGFILATSAIIVAMTAAAVGAMLLVLTALPSGEGNGGGPGAFVALLIGVSLVIGVLYLTMRWAPAFPAIVNERLGPRAALSRAWHLSADHVWRIFFIITFVTFTTALLASAISQLLGLLILGLLAPALGLDELVAKGVTLTLGTVLVAAFAPVITAVLYFDLRARRDVPSAAQGTVGR